MVSSIKWVFQYMETINNVWIGMARMEMVSNLKTSGRIFQVSALVSHIKSLKTNFGLFSSFENSFNSPLGGLKAIHV